MNKDAVIHEEIKPYCMLPDQIASRNVFGVSVGLRDYDVCLITLCTLNLPVSLYIPDGVAAFSFNDQLAIEQLASTGVTLELA